jgi:hypothetical protein
MSTPRKRWKAIALLGLCCVVLAGLIALPKSTARPAPKVTILDKRLQIFSVETVAGTNTCYLSDDGSHIGNQLGGRIASKLHAWGVPVYVPPYFAPGKRSDSRAFIICYYFPLPPMPSAHLDAELVAADGTIFPMHTPGGGGYGGPPGGGPPRKYWNGWMLESPPPNIESCVVRLKLQTNGMPVGEIRFGQR